MRTYGSVVTYREVVEEALNAAFEAGRDEGLATGWRQGRGSEEVIKADPRMESLESQLKLVAAVSQAMDVQSRLLTGLAQALDNVRVL